MEKSNVKMKWEYLLEIAEIVIKIRTYFPVKKSEEFVPFIKSNKKEDVVVEFMPTKHLDIKKEKELFSDTTFRIYKDYAKKGYSRVYCDPQDNNEVYAFSRFSSDNRVTVYYLKKKESFLYCMHNIFAYIAFEEMMLRHGAIILHASFVHAEHGGILFSGPSGIGKSTQADLWKKYCKADILNGDRTIIKEVNNVWKAYGSPYAGSSNYYVNKSAEIRCIVLLEQGMDCKICRLKPSEAFGGLYAGTIVNTWNKKYIEQLTDILQKIVLKVPVYRLWCNKSRQPVEMLKNLLEREDSDGK